MVYPLAMALNESGVGNIHNFQPISRRILEMVQVRTKVTINRKSRMHFRLVTGNAKTVKGLTG